MTEPLASRYEPPAGIDNGAPLGGMMIVPDGSKVPVSISFPDNVTEPFAPEAVTNVSTEPAGSEVKPIPEIDPAGSEIVVPAGSDTMIVISSGIPAAVVGDTGGCRVNPETVAWKPGGASPGFDVPFAPSVVALVARESAKGGLGFGEGNPVGDVGMGPGLNSEASREPPLP